MSVAEPVPVDVAAARRKFVGRIGYREQLLVFCFVNWLTFDFKGREGGGNIIQLLLVALTVFSGLAIVFQDKAQAPIRSLTWVGALLVGVVLLNFVNVFVAVVSDTPEYDVLNSLRMSAALVMAPMGLLVAHTLARRGYPMGVLMKPALFSALVNAYWRLVVGRRDTGSFSLEGARWEILSPILFVLAAAGLVGLLFNRRLDWVGYASLATFVFVAFASATRSLFLGAGASVAMLPLLWLLSGRLKEPRFVMRLVLGAVGLIVTVSIAFTALSVVRPDFVESMARRNTSGVFFSPSGEPHDVTLMQREAQVVGMNRELNKNPYSFLFGRGLGVTYYLDRYYEGAVPTAWFYTGPADFSDLGLYYMVYAFGWLVGGAVVALIAVIPIVGVVAASKLSRQGAEDEATQVARAALALAGFFALNFTWAGTYERGSMLVFGMFTGVILVGWHRAKGGHRTTLEELRIASLRRAAALR